MDDPGYAWPAWKFGMKRDDLFTKLHDQYNTFSSTIQDPEAFHHDVFEIAHEAHTEDDFHHLLARRRQERLDELNESLESAAVEIIANPNLIGTGNWSMALQLFRTRSLDSLVRYFADYLPEGCHGKGQYHVQYQDHDLDASSVASSVNDACSVHSVSTDPSSVGDVDVEAHSLFHDDQDRSLMTCEPKSLRISTTVSSMASYDLPSSPRSVTMQNDSSASSPTDSYFPHHDKHGHHGYAFRHITPARSLSFSGSESDGLGRERPAHLSDDEETSQSGDSDSLAASISGLAKDQPCHDTDAALSTYGTHHTKGEDEGEEDLDYYEDFSTAQMPSDIFYDSTIVDSVEDSETSTPKPEHSYGSSCLDHKLPTPTPINNACRRAPSPCRGLSSQHLTSCSSIVGSRGGKGGVESHHRSYRSRSPAGVGFARRSPEEDSSRISKPLPDPARTRITKGRRRGLD